METDWLAEAEMTASEGGDPCETARLLQQSLKLVLERMAVRAGAPRGLVDPTLLQLASAANVMLMEQWKHWEDLVSWLSPLGKEALPDRWEPMLDPRVARTAVSRTRDFIHWCEQFT